MLSVAPERPVDPLAIEILKQVDRVAQELGLEYFVTGAAARDILLSGVFGLDTGRGTKDVDLAIAIDDWLQFDTVKRRLVETRTFAPDERVIHGLLHLREPGRRSYPLDRLYGAEIEILETLRYDLGLAGPRLLGRDAARITGPTTRNQILALLDDARRWGKLLGDMARAFRGAEDPIAKAEALIVQFKEGLREI